MCDAFEADHHQITLNFVCDNVPHYAGDIVSNVIGYHYYIEEVFSTVVDTICTVKDSTSTVWDTISTVEDIKYCGGKSHVLWVFCSKCLQFPSTILNIIVLTVSFNQTVYPRSNIGISLQLCTIFTVINGILFNNDCIPKSTEHPSIYTRLLKILQRVIRNGGKIAKLWGLGLN